MRSRRRGADRRAADLHRDDRLAVFAGARDRLGEQRAILDRLDITGDRLRLGIISHERDAVGDRDIGLVAGAHPNADLDAAARRQRQQMRPERTRLRHHPERAGLGRAFLEKRAEGRRMPGAHVEEAETIRPAQPDAAVVRDLGDPFLHRAAFGSDLGKAGGEHYDAFDALGDAALHGFEGEVRRDRNDGAFDRPRNRGEIGIGGQPLHRVARRVDRVEPTLVAGLAVIAQRAAADAGWVVGRAEDRDRARGEKRC